MAGVVVNMLPKTTFDFSNLDVFGETANIPIGVPVEITQYAFVGVVVRLHSANIDPSSLIQVSLAEDGFLDGSAEAFPGQSDAFIEFSSSDVPPMARFYYSRLNSQYASLTILGYRGAAAPLMATISVDVYMRNGDETQMVYEDGVWRPVSTVDPSSLLVGGGGVPSIRRAAGGASGFNFVPDPGFTSQVPSGGLAGSTTTSALSYVKGNLNSRRSPFDAPVTFDPYAPPLGGEEGPAR